MAIDFSQIVECAGSRCRKIVPAPERNIVGCDDLRPELSHFASDCLYSGPVSRLPKGLEHISDGNFMLLADEALPQVLLASHSCNLLVMETKADYDACIENIKRVFDIQIRVNNFSYGILNMCHENRGVQEMLNAAYQAIGNPIMLVDASLFLMKHAGMETVRNEEQIDFTLTHGLLPEVYLNTIMAEEERHSHGGENELIVWESTFFQHRMVAGRILKNGRLIGYLKVLEYNRPITRLEEYYISILCKFFSITLDEFYGADPTGNPMVESFLNGLLEQKITDADVIQSRAERIDLELYDTKYVITAEFVEKYRNTDRLYLLKKQLKNHLNRSTVVVYQDTVVALYDVKNMDALSPDSIKSLSAVLEANGCRAAVSMPFHRLGDFYKSYVQTRSCLLTAQKLGRTETVVRYEDFIVEHMFLHFSDVFDLNDLVHPSVKLLLRHDKEKNTDFTETLFCYVRHKNDITAAAKALNVHYNTLKYRINRIVELTGVDFDDEMTAFQLIISDKILGLVRSELDGGAGE
ncbi:MAG: hypothetical protein HFF09_05645 [Oscillospiraceae bacterium]|nr:hypothetical protein [Oscillospiraceae bacterium]